MVHGTNGLNVVRIVNGSNSLVIKISAAVHLYRAQQNNAFEPIAAFIHLAYRPNFVSGCYLLCLWLGLSYRVAQKPAHFVLCTLTSSNIDRFQTYFTVRIRRTFVIIVSLKIPPHLKCVATLLYLVKCQCIKSINWKQDNICNN